MSSTSRTILISALTSALVTSVMMAIGTHALAPETRTNEGALQVKSPSNSESSDIVEAVKTTSPAVASVIISKDVPVMERHMVNPFGDDPFFQQFFGGPGLQVPQMRQNGTEHREVGGGTAFFISSDGLLMTNKHVVSDEHADYTVFLNDGRKLEAKVVTMDPGNDIALLKVEGTGFPYLAFSDTEPELGQQVIAIGNSLGEFNNTVSVGVLSGLSRTISAGDQGGSSMERLSSILQTDAAINHGNSGGPLLSTDGKVLGMNTAIAESAENIGFAIPAKDLKRAVESYKKNGRIVRPYLGVRYVPITQDMKEKNNLSVDYGVLVVRGNDPTELAVLPGSPADKAGIEENDIILEMDGKKLDEETALADLIREKSPGDTATLLILHKGERKTITVMLEEQK